MSHPACKRATVAIAIAITVAGCSLIRSQRSQATERCERAGALLGEASALRGQGYLGRSLDTVELATALCPSLDSQRALADTLADIGLTAQAIDAYTVLASSGDETDAARAAAQISDLEKRPPATRAATDEERSLAVQLYRDGVNQRLEEDFELSLKQLRRSYALWPDPVTIVQIGLTHRAAGKVVEARRANARALAIAELITGAPAEPRAASTTSGSVAVTVAARSRLIVSLERGGRVQVWDGLTGQPRRSFRVAPTVDVIAASPDGASLAMGSSANSSIEILNLRTGIVLAPTAADVDVHVWDALDGSSIRSLELHEGLLGALGFGDDGVHAAVAPWTFKGVAISADGLRRAYASHDGVIAIAAATGVVTIEAGLGTIHGVAFDAQGDHVVVTSDEHIVVYDVSDGRELYRAAGCAEAPSVAYLGGDSRVVCAAASALEFWDVEAGKPVTVIRARRAIRAADFADDGQGVHLWLEGDSTGSLIHVRVPDGESNTRAPPDLAAPVEANHPSRPLRAVFDGTAVTIRDADTDTPIATLPGTASRLMFSSDGTRLIQVARGGLIVWRVGSWEDYQGRVIDESDYVVTAAINTDATLALVVRADGLATLWDMVDGNALATIAGTADGSWLILAPSGGVEGASNDDGAADQLFWKVGDDQLPGFVGWQRRHQPDLLESITAPTRTRTFGPKGEWYEEDRLPAKIGIPLGLIGLGFEIYNIVKLVQWELGNPWIGLAQGGYWGTVMWFAGHGCSKTDNRGCITLSMLAGAFAVYGLYTFALGVDAFESSESATVQLPPTPSSLGYRRTF